MVVGHFVLGQPVGNLVFVLLLDVPLQRPEIAVETVDGRPASLLSPLVQILISRRRRGESLQNQKPGEPKCPLEAALEDGRVDAGALKVWPVDLEAPVAVFGQPVFVRWAAARQVNVVDLGHV